MSLDHPLITLTHLGEGRYRLPVENRITVGRDGRGFLFGGAGLASSLLALEHASGKPTLWATAQYLSYARPGSVVDIQVVQPVIGKNLTQARATLFAEDGSEILTTAAALGSREGMTDQWPQLDPTLPSPDDCAEAGHWGDEDRIGNRFRFRAARGFFADTPPDRVRSETGRLAMWVSPKDSTPVDRITLAIIADFFTPGIRNATGRRAGGNSLDNSIRFCAMVPTAWVLCDIAIDAIASGIAHGHIHIYAQTGELLAVAGQSVILRVRD